MALENLQEIETKVNRLLERHERVVKEKELAEKQLRLRESEYHQLKGQVRQFERERSEIKEKLEKILGHIGKLDLP